MPKIVDIFDDSFLQKEITVQGWVKQIQPHSQILFLQINDGSTLKNLQTVYKHGGIDVTIGSAVSLAGTLQTSKGAGQEYELLCEKIEILSLADPSFPIQKNNISFDYLRTIPQHQHRTQTIHAVSLIKHELVHAIHDFFYQKKFIYINPPIFTTNSCEGGSDVFELSNEGNDFFKQKTLLSVSGQFFAEAAALGLKDVYLLSPTFRSEKSNSSHHLAEFWMLEIESNFSGLQNMIQTIEEFLKKITTHILEKCHFELTQLQELIPNNENLIDKLTESIKHKFAVIEYSKAIEQLQESVKDKKVTFLISEIVWGMNLSSEHEKYLSKKIYKSPVFVINYPKEIKAFYMKQNADKKTVACTDLLLPEIGELIGGSEREIDVEIIKENCKKLGIPISDQQWYLDLRKFGYYKSSGFGMGFERLLMWFAGLKNIKETTLFPRSYRHIQF